MNKAGEWGHCHLGGTKENMEDKHKERILAGYLLTVSLFYGSNPHQELRGDPALISRGIRNQARGKPLDCSQPSCCLQTCAKGAPSFIHLPAKPHLEAVG